MKHIRWIEVLIVLLIPIVICGAETSTDYVDRLYAPPTKDELKTVFDSMRYSPKCEGIATESVYLEAPGYVIYKIRYLSDGLKQSGLFGWPKIAGKAPLAMIDHAGFSGFTKFDNPRLVQYLERGYAVAVATYRGEAGAAGLSEGELDVLGYESHDIMNLMECASRSDVVDPNRIVMMGVSHGGGLSIQVLELTGKVKAAAVASAPTNLMNENMKKMAAQWRVQPGAVETMLQILMRKDGIAKMKKILGVKEQDPSHIEPARKEMLRRSPALFADHINTPLMLYYGGKDPVACASDGKIIAASLERRGVFNKLTVFEDRGHSYSGDENETVHREIIDFFDSIVMKK